MPYALFYSSLTSYALFTMALVITNLVSGIIYLVYPTTFDRKDPVGNSFCVRLTRKIYSMDSKILSCLPSLHCALSTLFIISTLYAPQMNIVIKLPILLISILVIPATVFVKQHMIIDVITAVPLAVASWYIAMAIGADAFLSFFNFI